MSSNTELIYDKLVEHIQKEQIESLQVKRNDISELLGIKFTRAPVSVTKDERITLPELMVVKMKPDSIGQKIGLRIGSVIKQINDTDIDPDTYYDLIKEHKDFTLTVNNSYCLVFQLMLKDPSIASKITYHY